MARILAVSLILAVFVPIGVYVHRSAAATAVAPAAAAPADPARWEVRIVNAAAQRPRHIALQIAVRYVGSEMEVPAPFIRVRDSQGLEMRHNGITSGGRSDRQCMEWLSLSPYLLMGVDPPRLSWERVLSCQTLVLTYDFDIATQAKPPFELLFADAAPVAIDLE